MATPFRQLFSAIVAAMANGAAASVALATTGADAPVFDPAISGPAVAERGQWRRKVQQVFDARMRTLVRRAYEVWDPEPSRDLDFVWMPDHPEAARSGLINGSGHLVWRVKGLPSYSNEGIISEYRGAMREGRPHGNGIQIDTTGFYYDGQWRRGQLHGEGTLKLPSGDEYVGRFRAGKASGAGRYIDITGEIYAGSFETGHRHGHGTTTLPNGRTYRSHWVGGKEMGTSNALRLAQATGKAGAGLDDDVRIGLTIDRRLPPRKPDEEPRPNKWDLWYAISNTPEGFVIQPDNARLMSVWKGNGRILATAEYSAENGDSHGVFGLGKSQLQPIKLNIEAQNRTTAPIQVTGAYIDVAESKTDLQPAIEMDHMLGDDGCTSGLFQAEFRLENYGWSPAMGATMTFSFSRPGQAPPVGAPAIAHRIGNIDKKLNVDLERHLSAAGVNVAGLKRYAKGGFPCKSNNKAQCLESAKALASLGSLAPLATMKDFSIEIQATGALEYTWRDAGGQQQRRSSPIVAPITLGQFKREAECGEGAGPEVISLKTQMLRLESTRYRLPISYRTSIPPGRVGRLIVPIDAAKSSSHGFRIVLQLSDGREIGSRPIRLTHYRPSWFSADEPIPSDGNKR